MSRSVAAITVLSLLPITSAVAQSSKKAVTICIAPTSVEANTGNPTAIIDAVRETFTTFLTGPRMQVKALSSRLQSQVREEAADEKCPYLLLTTAKHTRKSGSGLIKRAAGAAVQQGAYAVGSAAGSKVGRVAGSVVAGAAGAAAYDFATGIKVKDEFALEYTLEAAGSNLVDEKDKRKAQSDGEDLLTPLVEKASEKIAQAIVRRPR